MFMWTPYKLALHLYDKYIEGSADLCINISHQNRKSIYGYFKQLSSKQTMEDEEKGDGSSSLTSDSMCILFKVFDDAFTEIWRLIQTDSFIRFKSTDEFRRLISKLYPEEAEEANDGIIKMVDRNHELQTERKNAIQRQIEMEMQIHEETKREINMISTDNHPISMILNQEF
eukprot:105234_1